MLKQLMLATGLGLLFLAPGLCRAQIELRLTPQDITIAPGDPLVLTIDLDQVQEVRSFEVSLSFDPEVLTFEGGEPGAAFQATGCSLFEGAEVDTSGTIHAYVVILGADCWASGPGQLFSLEFTGVANGNSPIQVQDVALFAPQTGELDNVTLNSASVVVSDVESDVPDFEAAGFALEPAWPNPFNPVTRIGFRIPEASPVWLGVYSLDGRLLDVLVDEYLQAGVHDVVWNGCDDRGRAMASGMYYYRMRAGGFSQVRSVILLK